MKAVSFLITECGNSASEAFYRANCIAQVDYGCSGETGTIADKKDYKMANLPARSIKNPFDWAREQIEIETVHQSGMPNYAECIKLDDSEYLFFGHAFQAGQELESGYNL